MLGSNESETYCHVKSLFIKLSLSERIGVGRFRIRGGGGQGGGQFPAGTWRHTDVDATQRRRIDVISTSCAHLVFNKSMPNNYISHLKI